MNYHNFKKNYPQYDGNTELFSIYSKEHDCPVILNAPNNKLYLFTFTSEQLVEVFLQGAKSLGYYGNEKEFYLNTIVFYIEWLKANNIHDAEIKIDAGKTRLLKEPFASPTLSKPLPEEYDIEPWFFFLVAHEKSNSILCFKDQVSQQKFTYAFTTEKKAEFFLAKMRELELQNDIDSTTIMTENDFIRWQEKKKESYKLIIDMAPEKLNDLYFLQIKYMKN